MESQAPDTAVRVRFAPSPTGHLHIGSARTALFNYAFARHHGGSYFLRIEDTDTERSSHMYTQSICQALEWLGLHHDGAIVYQSERSHIYESYYERLIASGHAYWSDPEREENGRSVLRFRIPKDQGTVAFVDEIHGALSVPLHDFDDFVIARSDGSPLYNFVVVVDDIEMAITHVVRGEDHIVNTHKQILLYAALGARAPHFAHLPLILGKSGGRLSKRDAATSVLAYRDMGILPEALCNYLARLGWSHGDREIVTLEEFCRLFTFADVNASNAMFDYDKLAWINGEHLRHMDVAELARYTATCMPYDIYRACDTWTAGQVHYIGALYQPRVTTVVAWCEALVSLHARPTYGDEELQALCQDACFGEIIQAFLALTTWDVAAIKATLREVCQMYGKRLKDVGMPLRYALTGGTQSPSLFELLYALGQYESIERIRACARACRIRL